MPAPIQMQFHPAECRFVEVLTTPAKADKLGYRLGGARPGPAVLVAGHSPVAEQVFERLLALPTLPRLRGELTLISLEALDATVLDAQDVALSGPGFDEILFLPYATSARFAKEAANQGFRTVLKLCARLGMIDGRGVH